MTKFDDSQHLIDLDDSSNIFSTNFKIEQHKNGGKFIWDPSRIKFVLSKEQENGFIVGYKLRKELDKENVINANLLDYLLKNQNLIPDKWRDYMVFFWGTIYRDGMDGNLFVRSLSWDGKFWKNNYVWLFSDFYNGSPALVLVN